jgi:hypothetical protein
LEKVVLNAFTTGVPDGRLSASSSAADTPGGVARLSHVSTSTGFEISTTTLPARRSPYCSAASFVPG